MLVFNLVVPEWAGNSNSEGCHVIEEGIEKVPNHNPYEGKNAFHGWRLFIKYFLFGNCENRA